jgi:hypothetical protein
MVINQFLLSLLHSLSDLDFVEKVDIHTEVFILKGRVILKKNRFLQLYFNEMTGTTGFALIEKDKRIWGIDYDNIRGWHLHPIENPDVHNDIDFMNVEDIIKALSEAWALLP